MPIIDFTNISYHASVERKNRMEQAKAIGWGAPLATIETTDERGTVYKTLTTTGIIIVRSKDNNMIITLYVAEVNQAVYIFKTAYGMPLPRDIYEKVKMNNIMFPAA